MHFMSSLMHRTRHRPQDISTVLTMETIGQQNVRHVQSQNYGYSNINQCPAGQNWGPGVHSANVDPKQQPGVLYQMKGTRFEPCRKTNDALKKVTGNIHEYQLWRDRIVDHLCRTNRHWRVILDTLQTWPIKVTKGWLMTQSHCGFSAWEITEIWEGVPVEHINDGLYRRRFQLCGGEKGNGLEMWRWQYTEFQRGSEAVRLGGSRRLQEWPSCNKLDQLNSHVDDWVECLQTHGTEMLQTPGMLRTMLLGIVPTGYEDKLLTNPQIKTWQEIIEWCRIKTIYKRQKVLAETARKPGGSRVNALHTEQDSPVKQKPLQPTPAESTEPPAWFKDYICRVGGPPPPRTPAGAARRDKGNGKGKNNKLRIHFSGRWHCGLSGHSRGGCPEFKALMSKHNKNVKDPAKWTLPAGGTWASTRGQRRKREPLKRQEPICLTEEKRPTLKTTGPTPTLTSWVMI